MISEKISPVNISHPSVTVENASIIKNIPSILGIDFLQRYTSKYDNDFIYLDR